MTSPKDDAKKDPLRQGDPKRPHATLDLKAVEIKPTDAKPGDVRAADLKPADSKPADPKSTTTSSSGSASNSATPGVGATAAPAATAAPGSTGAASGAATSAGAAKPTASAAAPSTAKPDTGKPDAAKGAAAPPPPAAKGGSGIGRFFSLLTAGVVGGFLALLGADTLGPQLEELGLPVGNGAAQQATNDLKARLLALEKSQQSVGSAKDADLTEKLAAANARLAKLEALDGKLIAVTEAQAKLQADAQAMAKKLGEAPVGDGAADARVAKLEQQLSLLANAADGSKGAAAIPQLAAVTGKVADLESTLANQIASLRKNVSEEIDTRIARTAEASEAARSGTQRIDREMADVKTEGARINQRLEAMKAEAQRLADTLRVVQEETGKVATAVEALKGDVAQKFKTVAKPEDVSSAIAPVSSKLATLEKSVESVVTAEDNRKANAERIVLSLELANLKRVVERGLAYSDELAQVKKAAAGKVDLAALDKYKTEGVTTLPELQKAFQPLSYAMIDAATQPADSGVVDRLLSGAKSVIRVRKVTHATDDDSAEAVVARMDKALDEGRIGDFMALKPKLPAGALAPATAFLQKVEARYTVDKALADIETQLKTSLGSAAAPAPATR
jgi:hypothetical protein